MNDKAKEYYRAVLNVCTGIMGTVYIWWFTNKMDVSDLELFWLCIGALTMQILFMNFESIHELMMTIVDKNYKNKD